MLQRFAAASSVGSVVIAVGALVSLLPPRWSAGDARVLTTAWCFVPLAWGLWTLLAPGHWVPRRLPLWGAILGIVAGIIAGPVLDLPLRLAGLRNMRWITVILGPILYYMVWLFVPVVYRSLGPSVELREAVPGDRT
jgi:hypothetical protein